MHSIVRKKTLIRIVIVMASTIGIFVYIVRKIALINIRYLIIRDAIACHYVTARGSLPSAEDITPPPDSIFFHETSCKGVMTSRQACSVESVARIHPERDVYVFFNSPITDLVLQRSCLAKLMEFKNVKLARLDTVQYARNTTLSDYLSNRKNIRSGWPVEHTSDLLRFITMYKYGGISLDTDLLVVKRLDALGKNWVAKQDNETVNIAAMGIGRDKLGRNLVTTILKSSIIAYIENKLQEALKEDKGTGCQIPRLDPFAKEVTQFDKTLPNIKCDGQDWVRCYLHECRVVKEILATTEDIECSYRDIIYESDAKYTIGNPTTVKGDNAYVLKNSDHVKIKCTGKSKSDDMYLSEWTGLGIGYRDVSPLSSPLGREGSIEVLIFGFDSTAKNGFIRRMPESYKFLTEELGVTVLNGYNIVGDGTPAALFPILTGKTELELPDVRKKSKNKGTMDLMPFIFYKLKEDGYRTAYFEDMPWIGTFQHRFKGFMRQPADHYLRAFYLEDSSTGNSWSSSEGTNKYCVGDTPRYRLMMNITEQFFKLPGKHFAFTFIADITHDDFNMISTADNDTVRFLKGLRDDGRLDNTILFFMGDHGPRYAKVRNTLQGKLEERLPLMAIRLPRTLTASRPDVQANLRANADALTTPHDIHATLLDAMGLTQYQNLYKINGADLHRGMTLFERIPRSRSCSEAGVEPHWCACVRWRNVSQHDPLYSAAAAAFVDFINSLTDPVRSKCVPRTLSSISYVVRQQANSKLLSFKEAGDADGYLGKFGAVTKRTMDNYQIKVAVAPGYGIYEASAIYIIKDDRFEFNIRDISRVNAYNNEPSCISATHPHLNMYCYCNA